VVVGVHVDYSDNHKIFEMVNEDGFHQSRKSYGQCNCAALAPSVRIHMISYRVFRGRQEPSSQED
jgi:hypothetical protein